MDKSETYIKQCEKAVEIQTQILKYLDDGTFITDGQTIWISCEYTYHDARSGGKDD